MPGSGDVVPISLLGKPGKQLAHAQAILGIETQRFIEGGDSGIAWTNLQIHLDTPQFLQGAYCSIDQSGTCTVAAMALYNSHCVKPAAMTVVTGHAGTHQFSLVPPLMVGALVSSWIGRRFNSRNFYEAILEQHRAHVATAISRLTGNAVKLDLLGGDDALPYSESVKNWAMKNVLK